MCYLDFSQIEILETHDDIADVVLFIPFLWYSDSS